MAGPNKFPETNSKILRNIAERAKKKLKIFGEYTGFSSPLISWQQML
jgi:hypothetical protein